MKKDEERIKEKVKFFYYEKCRVHVNRFDGTFWNGLITSEKSEGVWDFHDDKLGECLLFIGDMVDINLCRKKNIKLVRIKYDEKLNITNLRRKLND